MKLEVSTTGDLPARENGTRTEFSQVSITHGACSPARLERAASTLSHSTLILGLGWSRVSRTSPSESRRCLLHRVGEISAPASPALAGSVLESPLLLTPCSESLGEKGALGMGRS